MKKIALIPLSKKVTKTISIPGSKSYTNRALIMAAITNGKVIIQNPLISDDTKAMISCLKQLGISVRLQKNAISVAGSIQDVKNKTYQLNADLSGTTIRFLLALCSVIQGAQILTGEKGLQKRPIGDLVEALKKQGAKIQYLKKEGYPPVKITSSTLSEGTISIEAKTSSQFASALLMITPLVKGLKVYIKGRAISKPYITMTKNIIKHFGSKKYLVEGDFSSAAYFFAIAALAKSSITVKNLHPNSVQGDKQFLKILVKMGNKIIAKDNQITILGSGVKPVTVNMINCPDQAQTLAVLAAFANGKTKISGIGSLRVKETERIKALEIELKKMGIQTSSTHDSLTIYGGNPKATTIDTYGDHRMAMAFSIAGAKLRNITIKNPEVVSKTFPDFWQKLQEIGIGVKTI